VALTLYSKRSHVETELALPRQIHRYIAQRPALQEMARNVRAVLGQGTTEINPKKINDDIQQSSSIETAEEGSQAQTCFSCRTLASSCKRVRMLVIGTVHWQLVLSLDRALIRTLHTTTWKTEAELLGFLDWPSNPPRTWKCQRFFENPI